MSSGRSSPSTTRERSLSSRRWQKPWAWRRDRWGGFSESTGSELQRRTVAVSRAGAKAEDMFKTDDCAYESACYQKKWTFDIKLTNTGNTILEFVLNDVAMKDKPGWVYKSSVYKSSGGAYSPYEFTKLLPGESLRFPVTFTSVGAFSSPSELLFRDVTMNIESWV